jgi:hypothetical protein
VLLPDLTRINWPHQQRTSRRRYGGPSRTCHPMAVHLIRLSCRPRNFGGRTTMRGAASALGAMLPTSQVRVRGRPVHLGVPWAAGLWQAGGGRMPSAAGRPSRMANCGIAHFAAARGGRPGAAAGGAPRHLGQGWSAQRAGMATAVRDTANNDEFEKTFMEFKDAPEWKDERQMRFTATLCDVDAQHMEKDEVRAGMAAEFGIHMYFEALGQKRFDVIFKKRPAYSLKRQQKGLPPKPRQKSQRKR